MGSEEQGISRGEYESDQKSIWQEIGRLKGILEGPPFPGLESQVMTFLTEFRTLETEREKQHKANKSRLNIIIGILSLLAAYLAVWHH